MADFALPDALALLRRQYPGAFVTSGTRDPNSALGRANPKSYHNVGEAFDVRPIPGVSFDSYVSKLKSAGLPVVEALDEAKNPKPWTTGPNWHIAFSGNKQVATNPIDLVRRAQGFNVDIPDDPQSFNEQPLSAQQGAPAFDIQSALANLPKANIPARSKGSMWGAILGALSDGLLVAGGRDPIYGPGMIRQREAEDERNFEREKLNATLEAQKAELLARLSEPPQFIQNAEAWARLSPEQKRQVLIQQDAVNPINVSTPQGTQNVPRTQTKTLNGKTYYQIGGQWYEEGN